jgi:hypothetical protein
MTLVESATAAARLWATQMLKAFAVRMLREYDWSVEGQDLSPTKGKLFATPASGLPVQLRAVS